MAKEPAEKKSADEPKQRTCGLVMPISERDGLGTEHWLEVREIIKESLADEALNVRLVSESLTADVIHKRIVHNLFNDDVCVCDISTTNPNVMFELGIRLTFQRPVVVIKDDQTKDPFDTGIIRYVDYPRSLRHKQIKTFSEQLRDAVREALNPKPGDEQFSFLKAIGPIDVPKIESKEVAGFEHVMNQLAELRQLVERNSNHQEPAPSRHRSPEYRAELRFAEGIDPMSAVTIMHELGLYPTAISSADGGKVMAKVAVRSMDPAVQKAVESDPRIEGASFRVSLR